jgi:acyl carrier protein
MATKEQVSNQPATLKEQIREFVRENLAAPKGITSFTDEEALTETGVCDSLGILRLVSFLEENLGVRVRDEEITADNLTSINVIEQFVLSKTQK